MMKLYAKCNKCNEHISFWTNNSTRVEFAMTEGESKQLACKSCGNTEEYHADEIEARESKIAHVLATLNLLIGTPLLIYFLWDYLFASGYIYMILVLVGLIGLPMAIYAGIHKSERDRVNIFNRAKLRGRL